jgi:hypothetical protein
VKFRNMATLRNFEVRCDIFNIHIVFDCKRQVVHKNKINNNPDMSIGMSINAIAYWAVFVLPLPLRFRSFIQGGSNMTGTNCDLFTHK